MIKQRQKRVKNTKTVKSTKNTRTTKNISNTKKPKEISIFTILFVLVIIAVCVGIYFGIRHIVITLKYSEYTKKMETYGFNTLYDNSKATATDKVSNNEMIKVVLGVILNVKDASELYVPETDNVSEQDLWYEYATYIGVNDNIRKQDLDNKANRIDAVMLATKLLEGQLNIQIDQAELKMNETKLSKFTQDEKITIAKAVNLGIVANKTASLKDKDILKGELNKLVITIAEEYATMYYGTVVINENGQIEKQNVNIVTKKDEKPNNYEDYPYIVDNIQKEVYEQEYKVLTQSRFSNPKETYERMGYLYAQTDEMLTRYFNNILNIDYETITNDTFLSSIKNYVDVYVKAEDTQEYVKYVKDNKIKIEGKATPLLPIMYNNGEQYVVRIKIEFKVINSATEYNLLFGDEDNKVKYTSKEIVMYVDVPTGMTLNSDSLRVSVRCLAENMSANNTYVNIEK